MRGIYVHVPFCVRKCGYCDFYSVAGGEEACDGFPALVEREMDLLLHAYPGEADIPADAVSFGGGTPTVLGRTGYAGSSPRSGHAFPWRKTRRSRRRRTRGR